MQERQTILEVLAKHAQCDPGKLAPGDSLADIGVDSLKFIVMMLEIEQVTGRKVFDIDNIGKLRTVGDILSLSQSP
jgi:acyl carrier protein